MPSLPRFLTRELAPLALKPLLVFLAMLLLGNLPNLLPWERAMYPTTYLLDMVERVVLVTLLLAALLCLFRRAERAWLVLWLLALSWLPAALVTRLYLYTEISPSLIGLVMETTPQESREFLKTLPLALWGLMLLWNLVCAGIYLLLRRWRVVWPLRYRVAYGCLYGALLLWGGWPFNVDPSPVKPTGPPLPVDSGDTFLERHEQDTRGQGVYTYSFPFELPYAYLDYVKKQAAVTDSIAQLRPDPRTLARSAQSPDAVVLVIGESSSRSHWGIFGATRDTTPQLQARQSAKHDLLLFDNVLAQSTATRYAVPLLLTHEPLLLPTNDANPHAEHSLISLVRQAGWHTAWFSNQSAGGVHDGPVTVYAKEAEELAFLNPSAYTTQGSYDEVLLGALERHLQSQVRTFTVLHTMGSHFSYAQRYPASFGRFLPALGQGPLRGPGADEETETRNAYDNSVLYTDHVLANVIDRVEATGKSALVLYVSDHGQDVFEPGCTSGAIGRMSANAYRIPLLLWMSPSYRAGHPQSWAAAQRHQHDAYTATQVSDTLLDLLQGDAALAARGTPSLLRDPLASGSHRVVGANAVWTDFEQAAARNACRITGP